jgi:hypothetical protein
MPDNVIEFEQGSVETTVPEEIEELGDPHDRKKHLLSTIGNVEEDEIPISEDKTDDTELIHS